MRIHDYGIELPKTFKRALKIDKETGTTLCHDIIHEEMKKVDVAFNVLEGGENVPVGYQQIDCHLVYDIKIATLQRKCRLTRPTRPEHRHFQVLFHVNQ